MHFEKEQRKNKNKQIHSIAESIIQYNTLIQYKTREIKYAIFTYTYTYAYNYMQ